MGSMKTAATTYQSTIPAKHLWGWSAFLWFLCAGGALLFAGPITWHIRGQWEFGSGQSGFITGTIAGISLLVGTLAILKARDGDTKGVVVLSILGSVISALLSVSFLPSPASWVLFGVFVALCGGAVLELLTGRGKTSSGSRVHILTFPAVLWSLCLGWIGTIVIAQSALFAPSLPPQLSGDAPTVLGSDGVEVTIMYAINSPAGAVIVADQNGSLKKLADNGTATFKFQAVAPEGTQHAALPYLTGSACAATLGDDDSLITFQRGYNTALVEAKPDAEADDLVLEAGKNISPNFRSCVLSGKFDRAAATFLDDMSMIKNQLPFITVDGKQEQPVTKDDLIDLIKKANK